MTKNMGYGHDLVRAKENMPPAILVYPLDDQDLSTTVDQPYEV